MIIVNLTQHEPTEEQLATGATFIALSEDVKPLLTFERLPDQTDLKARARALALWVRTRTLHYPDSTKVHVLIGGAPFFMAPLEQALGHLGLQPIYAFTQRVSTEETQPDGTVRKVSKFHHEGWYAPPIR